MPRRDDIQTLIALYNRRLQKLREQAALKGISTPPEISLEIEDIEAKLAGFQAELETAPAQSVSSLSDAELAQELTFGDLTWQLYESTGILGLSVDIAVTTTDDLVITVVMLSEAADRDALYEMVYLPMIEAAAPQ